MAEPTTQINVDLVFDYSLEIPAECAAPFRNLIRAGIDALGDDPEDLESIKLGRQVLGEIS
jgi:hypothetical protein